MCICCIHLSSLTNMFCIKCGTKNDENVKFCVSCGQKIGTDNTAEANDIVQNNTQPLPTARRSIWKILLKIVLILILVPIIISALTLSYQWYQDLPHPVNQLGSIKLGMKPVEVTLALGKPSQETTDSQNRLRYIYTDYGGSIKYFITFNEATGASQICSEDYLNEVLGLGIYDDEKRVINKLGEPSKVSINKEGLMKLISYSQYNIAFGIKEGDVYIACVSDSEMSFVDEYSN